MHASDTMVVWLAVANQGHQWRHGGVAGGTWLLLEGQEALARRGARKAARGPWRCSYGGGEWAARRGDVSKVEARVDDPIRPSGGFSVEARVDVPIRSGEVKTKVVSCVSGSFVSVCVVQLRFWWRLDEGEVNGAARWYQVTPTAKQARILEESSGGSGEAPVRFKVVCPRSGVRRWMWRGPHA